MKTIDELLAIYNTKYSHKKREIGEIEIEGELFQTVCVLVIL